MIKIEQHKGVNVLSVGKKKLKQIAYNISLNPTKPKWNEHNISKLYFGLAVQRLSLPANYKMQESDKY